MHMCQTRLLVFLFIGTTLLTSCGSPPGLTVTDIITHTAEAMGGSDNRLPELRALRFAELAPGGPTTVWAIRRPGLVRKEREGAWTLLFDGQRAGYLEGPRRPDGTLEGPHLVSEGDWRDFEMDIALYVPAFLEYPAAYVGDTTVEGAQYDKSINIHKNE